MSIALDPPAYQQVGSGRWPGVTKPHIVVSDRAASRKVRHREEAASPVADSHELVAWAADRLNRLIGTTWHTTNLDGVVASALALTVIDRLYVDGAPRPSFSLGDEGEVEIEWESHGTSIYADCYKSGRVEFSVIDPEGDTLLSSWTASISDRDSRVVREVKPYLQLLSELH